MTLKDMREAREAATEREERLKAIAARRWHALRVLIALALILLAYWSGYQFGYLEGLRK